MKGAKKVDASRAITLVWGSFKPTSELVKVTSTASVVATYAPVSGSQVPVEKLTTTSILLFLFQRLKINNKKQRLVLTFKNLFLISIGEILPEIRRRLR